MPLLVRRDDFTFLVCVLAIVPRQIMIEKAHQGAVRHQRHNALSLIVGELQSADPAQDDDESQAKQAHPSAVKLCRRLINTPYHGLLPRICANGSADMRRHSSSPQPKPRLWRRV